MPAFDPQISRIASMFAHAAQAAASFERDWLQGKSPQLEDYLPRGDSHLTEVAFLELLRIEIRCRQAQRRDASKEALSQQFNQFQSLIVEYFEVTNGSHSTTKFSVGSTIPGASFDAQLGQMDETILIAGYRLLDQIGEGGMGIVYRAIQPGTERVVALKIIRPEFLLSHRDDFRREVIHRFLQESRATAKLTHENIVTVYEVGECEDELFLSMQYLSGGSLACKLRNGPLSPAEAARIAEQVCEGVQVAHRHGIIHRDIKPSNVLFDENDKALLSDFGLAKVTGETALPTPTGLVLGTPAYMPPEQFSAPAEIGLASDVYSIGATLYQMLAGRPPFAASEPLEVLRQVAEMNPVPIRKLNPSVPRDLETIAHKCLEKLPSKRYANACALQNDLRCFQNGEPITARPVSNIERAVIWMRRNPTVATTAFGLAMALLVLVGATTWYFTHLVSLRAIVAAREASQALGDAVNTRNRGLPGWTYENEARLRPITRQFNSAHEMEVARDEFIAMRIAFDIRDLGTLGPDFDGYGFTWSHDGQQFLRGENTVYRNEAGEHCLRLHVYNGLPRAYVRSVELFAADQAKIESGEIIEGVRSLAFLPGDEQVLIGARSGWIYLFDLSRNQLVHRWKAHADKVLGLALDEKGTFLLSTGNDDRYRIWETKTWTLQNQVQTDDNIIDGHAGLWLPDRLIVSGFPPLTEPLPGKVINYPTPELPKRRHNIIGLRGFCGFVAVSRDHYCLVDLFSASRHTFDVIRPYSDATGKISCSISPDEKWLAICDEEVLVVYELFSGRKVLQHPVSGLGDQEVSFDPIDGSLWLTKANQLRHLEVRHGDVWSTTRSHFAPDYGEDGKMPEEHFELSFRNHDFELVGIKRGGNATSPRHAHIGSRKSSRTDVISVAENLASLSKVPEIRDIIYNSYETPPSTIKLQGETLSLLPVPLIRLSAFSTSTTANRFWKGSVENNGSDSVGLLEAHELGGSKLLGQYRNQIGWKRVRRTGILDIECGTSAVHVLFSDFRLRLFDIQACRMVDEFELDNSTPYQLAISPDGVRSYIGTEEGDVLLVDHAQKRVDKKFITCGSGMRAIAASATGVLSIARPDGEIEFWDVQGLEPVKIGTVGRFDGMIDYLEFTKSGDSLAIHLNRALTIHYLDIQKLFRSLIQAGLHWDEGQRILEKYDGKMPNRRISEK